MSRAQQGNFNLLKINGRSPIEKCTCGIVKDLFLYLLSLVADEQLGRFQQATGGWRRTVQTCCENNGIMQLKHFRNL